MTCSFIQTRQQHILAVTLDPGGEWLACACLDGGVYLIPVIALTLVRPKELHVNLLLYSVWYIHVYVHYYSELKYSGEKCKHTHNTCIYIYVYVYIRKCIT